jgi:uncharacterized repeat protein (TIGR01451 family)
MNQEACMRLTKKFQGHCRALSGTFNPGSIHSNKMKYIPLLALLLLGLVPVYAQAAANLTVEPVTWNVIGLDSNNINVGPNQFPVGARVCNTGTGAANATVDFVWDDGRGKFAGDAGADPYINLRPGTSDSLILSLSAGECKDAYFEAEVTRSSSAYNKVRRYHITAADASGTVSTPTPRELYVERLISQNRNAVLDIQYGTSLEALGSVARGGTMTLVEDQDYYIRLISSTATNGYEQITSFINLPNSVFEILSIATTYTAGPTPKDTIYSDACTWENDPNSPNYRSCLSTGKNGGNITVTYHVRIISEPSALLANQPLGSLIYDFSGASYHYNTDFGVSAIFAKIESASLFKSFSPKTINPGGTSTLTFTITNPGTEVLAGVNFYDNLPSGVSLSGSTVTYTGCGTPSPASFAAGATSLQFSNIAVAGLSSCTASVSVTASTDGTYNNTSGNLFINSTTDTGSFATDSLTVTSKPAPPSSCDTPVTMATWTMPAEPAQGSGGPPPPYTTKAADVNTAAASAALTALGTQSISTAGATTNAWNITDAWSDIAVDPGVTAAPYVQFSIDSSNFGKVQLSAQYNLQTQGDWASNANNNIYIYSSTDGANFSLVSSTPATKGSWQPAVTGTAATTGESTTYFRITANTRGNKTTAGFLLDNIIIAGCPRAELPTLSKIFVPSAVAQGSTSVLRFTLANPNTATALTGVGFSDTLPAGLLIAEPNDLTASCTTGTLTGGTITAAAGTTTISLGGATLSANSSCTISVNVLGNVAGQYTNTSGTITSAETGPNTTSSGYGISDLTVIAPPSIAKGFGVNTLITGHTTSLTFSISNPNISATLTGMQFTDILPAGLLIAAPNGLSGTCGGGTITAASGSSGISLSSASLAAGESCTFSVNVTGTASGFKTNSVTVSSTNGGTGNTATASILVKDLSPALSIIKKVGVSVSGPWFDTLSVAAGSDIYYRFTVENTGDAEFISFNITDPILAGTFGSPVSCTWTTANSPSTLPGLPVGTSTVEPSAACVVGPATASSGTHLNTATAHGAYNLSTYDSDPDTAAYATTGLNLVKSIEEIDFSFGGDLLHYSYLVTNSGYASLKGPVAVTDDKVLVTCPDVSTTGDLDNYLDPGESLTCTAVYTVTPEDVEACSVANTAFATVSGVISNTDIQTVNCTLVFLSGFRAYEEKGKLRLEWTTSYEIDTAGFYLVRLNESSGSYRQINRAILPGLLTSGQGGTYSIYDHGASLTKKNTYWLVEIEGKGTKNIYGPFTVTAGGGNALETWNSFNAPDLEFDSSGKLRIEFIADETSDFTRTEKPVSEEKKASLEARKAAKKKSDSLKLKRKGSSLKIPVSSEGLYYLDSLEISNLLGIDRKQAQQMIKTANFSLSSQGKGIAYIPSEDNSGLYFYGGTISSIYSRENIYWLSQGRGFHMSKRSAGSLSSAAVHNIFTETVHAEEDKMAAPVLAHGNPESDYWFWDYIIGGNASLGKKTFTMESYNKADTSSEALLRVSLHGLTDTGVKQEHHAAVSLNGKSIGEGRWEGAQERIMTLSFSQELLNSGANTVEVKGMLNTGVPYSIFYINSFDLTYQKISEARNNLLMFTAESSRAFEVSGFTSPDIFILDITEPGKPVLQTATAVSRAGSTYKIRFIPQSGSRYMAATPDSAVRILDAWAYRSSELSSTKNKADYIMITTAELAATAQELADYRQGQGLTSMVVDLEEIMDEFNYGISSPWAIHDFLRFAYENWQRQPKYVVLVGDGTFDYKNNMGAGDNLVPTLMTWTPQVISPSDNLLADMDGDHVPDIAIGRLPVVTAEELKGVIQKIRAYESTVSTRVLMLADNKDDGGDFPSDSDELAKFIPADYSIGKIYLSTYTVKKARELLFRELKDGTVLLSYAGHSGMDRFASEGLLLTTDVASLQNSGKYPVVIAMTCSAGNFSMPGYDSLSEALVTKKDAGAVAVWAPAGLSFNFLSKILGENFFINSFGKTGIRLGDLILKAFKEYKAAGNPEYVIDIFNLQGDPAMNMR